MLPSRSKSDWRYALHWDYTRAPMSPATLRQIWMPPLPIYITATLDLKIAARLEHRSQTADPAALAHDWRRRAAEMGASAGLAAAEAFKRLTL